MISGKDPFVNSTYDKEHVTLNVSYNINNFLYVALVTFALLDTEQVQTESTLYVTTRFRNIFFKLKGTVRLCNFV